jgi:hypothetical protein
MRHFWKGAIQGPFHQSLVQIGLVASEELIKMWKFNGRTDDGRRTLNYEVKEKGYLCSTHAHGSFLDSKMIFQI